MLLRIHDHSLRVVRLQLQLRHTHCYDGFINGLFDEETDEAVRLFQRKNGLMVDGLAGSQTLGLLDTLTKNAYFILFLHATATREGQHWEAQTVVDYQINERNFLRPGYSDIDQLDGLLVNVREWNQDDLIHYWETTWGVKESTLLNRNARHYCYVGGMDEDYKYPKDTRTPTQMKHMKTYIDFNIMRHPKLIVAGHNQVQNKACPCFDVPEYLDQIGVPKWNQALWGKLYY